MNTSSIHHRIIIFFIFSFAPVFLTSSFAQDTSTLNPDSTAMENIDMADISIMSSETILDIKQLINWTLSDNKRHVELGNDSVTGPEK